MVALWCPRPETAFDPHKRNDKCTKSKVNFLPYFHITRKLLLPWQPLTPMPKPLAFKAAEMFYSVLSAQGLKLLVTVPPGREVPHPHSLNVLSTQHGNATLHCQMVPSFTLSKLGLPKNDMAPYGTQKYAAVRKKTQCSTSFDANSLSLDSTVYLDKPIRFARRCPVLN